MRPFAQPRATTATIAVIVADQSLLHSHGVVRNACENNAAMSSPDSAPSETFPTADAVPTSLGIPPDTRALVDGIGVYTASSNSPFLTVPTGASVSSAGVELVSNDPATPRGRLHHLEEPLRRQISALPLRPRVSEEEVSGLVAAVLELIAQHIPPASDAAPTKL
jgi:hypothetical protein